MKKNDNAVQYMSYMNRNTSFQEVQIKKKKILLIEHNAFKDIKKNLIYSCHAVTYPQPSIFS